jgi:hypothetical protein
MAYDTEQGAEYGDDATRLDDDLKPWLRREWDLDLFLTEFPYHQYAGVDFPAREDKKVRNWLEQVQDEPDLDSVPDSVKQKGPYRTDLVGIRVDRRALRTRIQRLGHHTPLNQPREGKRRYRRTYLTFAGDGPMTRNYWENEHGGPDELRSYGEHSASRAFGWLKNRRFLAPIGKGRALWDAVDIPLHVHRGVHAVELKVERREWDTALEQARRARVFADYRWTAMDADAADPALANADAFRDAGVGLLTVHPEDGVQVHVWAERCTPEVDRDLLDRYMVERWDVNERALMKLETRYEKEQDPDADPERWVPGVPDILGELDLDNLETEPDPPTVNGHTAAFASGQRSTSEDPDHKPLSAFTGEGKTGP